MRNITQTKRQMGDETGEMGDKTGDMGDKNDLKDTIQQNHTELIDMAMNHHLKIQPHLIAIEDSIENLNSRFIQGRKYVDNKFKEMIPTKCSVPQKIIKKK